MTDTLAFIFSQQFLIRALVVGVLISLSCALLGVSLVLKRYSMIGDGLSHVGFGALSVALAVNITPMYFALPVVVGAAFLLLNLSERGKIKGDAAIALISTGALALGVMVTSMTQGMNVDVYNYMFGSVLAMSRGDVAMSVVLCFAVILLFLLFYNEIFAVTFDESFARSAGMKTRVYNMLIAALTAVTIVVGMRMMGALLMSSLIIFPCITSMRLCKSFRSVTVCSALVSVFCFISGLLISIRLSAPTGASVVIVNIVMLLAFFLSSRIIALGGFTKIKLKKALSALLIAVCCFSLLVFGLSGSPTTDVQQQISVVAVTFAPYDFARSIAGDRAQVSMLLKPGQESHTYEPSAQDILKIRQCDVFIYNGSQSESWVDEILSSLDGTDIVVVKMMDVVDKLAEEHEHEHEHENEDEAYDEHVWTSVYNTVKICREINSALCEADAENADYYTENYENYAKELTQLDEEFILLGKSAVRPLIIADRFPLRYMTERYGIDYFSAYPGCSAQAQVDPVTLASLIKLTKDENIEVVFKVDLSSGTLADSVSAQTGAKVQTLYSCHVISADDYDNGESYISLMRRNLVSIASAVK